MPSGPNARELESTARPAARARETVPLKTCSHIWGIKTGVVCDSCTTSSRRLNHGFVCTQCRGLQRVVRVTVWKNTVAFEMCGSGKSCSKSRRCVAKSGTSRCAAQRSQLPTPSRCPKALTFESHRMAWPCDAGSCGGIRSDLASPFPESFHPRLVRSSHPPQYCSPVLCDHLIGHGKK
jgi:hypothetical protein